LRPVDVRCVRANVVRCIPRGLRPEGHRVRWVWGREPRRLVRQLVPAHVREVRRGVQDSVMFRVV
jgi:hypothetical protein